MPLLATALIILLVLVLFLLAYLLFRAMLFGRLPEPVEALEPPAVNADQVAQHLSALLQIQTVSYQERDQVDEAAFDRLQAALRRMYPRLHDSLQREVVNRRALLYTWPGADPALPPVLFMAHQDVVPADPATLDAWTHPPFSGDIADDFVWGRGALDMKSVLVTLCESVEALLELGYQPDRTLYLAFGHDEEIGGQQGAACVADLLAQRGVRLEAVLDEGSALTRGLLPGLQGPVALIGVAEKGHVTLELKVEGRPGHSSTPPPHTAIGVLARAVTRLEANPMPAHLGMTNLMFQHLGAYLPIGLRLACANTWLFGGAVRSRLEASPQSAALLRTTTAPTVIRGGLKDNILPAQASALVNFRLYPGDSLDDLVAHARRVIHDDAVQIAPLPDGSWEASPVSPVNSPVYHGLSRAIRQLYPAAAVAPYLVLGATDSRYFTPLSAAVYRFSPYYLDAGLLNTIHGIDERIAVPSLAQMVQFYTHLMREWTAAP